MNILALDSSSTYASVAIMKDGIIAADIAVNNGLVHSRSLLPMAEYALQSIEMSIKDIDVFAVTVGPGSFTGVRIGVSTIKAMAQVNNKPCVAINTLNALAYNILSEGKITCPIMDARREQVYTAAFDSKMNCIIEPMAVGIDELLAILKTKNEYVIFCGDGVEVFQEKIMAALNTKASFAPTHLNYTRAASCAQLSIFEYEKNNALLCEELDALYLRKPQAEREYDKKLTF